MNKSGVMFFSYDHEDGIEFHDTAEKAKVRAEKCFQYDRDEAPEGWNEEVDQICWGTVCQKIAEVSCKKAEPGNNYDEEVEYALLPATAGEGSK